MSDLESRIGYHFRNPALLSEALTHPSYSAEHPSRHYQRLEFLGDAVFELVVSRRLYFAMPQEDEGRLTKLRAELVREESLAEAARDLSLGSAVRLSLGEARTGGADKNSILCDVMEALVGAIYLDGGLEAAETLILRVLDRHFSTLNEDRRDAKTRLQEELQKHGRMPEYRQIEASGPAHDPSFTFQVLDGETVLGTGIGSSKRAAQQAAAEEALRRLDGQK